MSVKCECVREREGERETDRDRQTERERKNAHSLATAILLGYESIFAEHLGQVLRSHDIGSLRDHLGIGTNERFISSKAKIIAKYIPRALNQSDAHQFA